MQPDRITPAYVLMAAGLILILVGAGIAPFDASATGAKAENPRTGTVDTVKGVMIPASLTLQEVDGHLAVLDDQPVRQVLALKPKEDAPRNAMVQTGNSGARGQN